MSGDITWLEIRAPLSDTEISRWSKHGVPIGRLENRIGDTMLRLQLNEDSAFVPLQPASSLKVNESHSIEKWVEGELLAAGSALARGYTRRPSIMDGSGDSAMNRWVTCEGDKRVVWFCTGDLVRVLGDCIFFCGRRDALVKIRGQRIQLEAVERFLEAAFAAEQMVIGLRVLQVVVLAMKDPSVYGLTSQSLVAFLLIQGDIQPVSSSSSSSGKLREYPEKAQLFKRIREKLSDAYVPRDAVLVPIDSVERLSSGKVDRSALRTLYEKDMLAAQADTKGRPQDGQTRSPVKQFVMAQAAKLLGIRSIGDDAKIRDLMSRCFQELGGNSLLVTLLSWELQQEFGFPGIQPHELVSVSLSYTIPHCCLLHGFY